MRIGVFDSGLGGFSVLAALRAHLPEATLHYIADSGHAPYGERSDGYIADRALALAARLADDGARMLVIACNTATAVAVDAIRAAYSGIPVVGIEPGIKPAAAATRNGRIAVMATPATLRSERFQALLATHGGGLQIHLQACAGLAAAIEEGNMLDAVKLHCAPLRASGADSVVLGCTHYRFARELISRELGDGVALIDAADAVARQAARLCGTASGMAQGASATLLQTTGELDRLQSFALRTLAFPVTATICA